MIQQVINIAKKASKEILKIYHEEDFEIHIKGDDSPVTKADLIANDIIIKGLSDLFNYPILTEETPVDYEIRKSWNKYWLVDPLDGTKDFIAKNNQFTINIALIHNNKPILGVVYIPFSDDVYYAEEGKGAYKNNNIIFNSSVRSELIGADSNFHSTDKMRNFFEKNKITNIKRFGSSIKICKLAEGIIDIYPRLNETKEWDTAASHIIASEAGCKLIDLVTGQEIVYNKIDIRNNHFVACRNDLILSSFY